MTTFNSNYPKHLGTILVSLFLSTSFVVHAANLYVWQDSPQPFPPYLTWASAAHTIQEAVDQATPSDLVIVTNGIYARGGRPVAGMLLTNRVTIPANIQVQSVNGPDVTIIQGARGEGLAGLGDEAARCANLSDNAVLSGFTLTDGRTRSAADIGESAGGGAWCASSAILTNCTIVENICGMGSLSNTNNGGGGVYGGILRNCHVMANGSYSTAGGALNSTLENCVLMNNRCDDGGGGASHSILRNCLVIGNYSDDGPAWGAAFCELVNCTLFGNRGEAACCGGGAYACNLVNTISYGTYNNYSPLCTVNFSCTTPLPPAGVGNISDDPLFVEIESLNFHLQSNSPCVNSGRNDLAPSGTDLDGVARILDGKVDMGAFEFHLPPSEPFLDIAIQTYAGLTITAKVGTILSIEYVTDLALTNTPGAWRNIEFLQVPSRPYLWVDKTAPTSGRRFYRAVRFAAPKNMVFIPPGTFRMGSSTNEADRAESEGPQTAVTISHGFWMGQYEVTQGEFSAVMGFNPSHFRGDTNLPVEQVSWFSARGYCGELQLKESAAGRIPQNTVFRLPTEAEWEYSCRAWTSTRFNYGEDPNYIDLKNYAWDLSSSGGATHPVGQRLANPWGLYDLYGNVWEWCSDGWAESLPGGISLDPKRPENGERRVVRGGSWQSAPNYCRSAFRSYNYQDSNIYQGFRVVLATTLP